MEPKCSWGDVTMCIDGKPIVDVVGGLEYKEPDDTDILLWARRYFPEVERVTEAMRYLHDALIGYKDSLRRLPPLRVRTGIAPRHGRTRRKQRLTRLQRRAKRQNKRK